MADVLGQKVLADSGGRQFHIIHGFESWCDLGGERLEGEISIETPVLENAVVSVPSPLGFVTCAPRGPLETSQYTPIDPDSIL